MQESHTTDQASPRRQVAAAIGFAAAVIMTAVIGGLAAASAAADYEALNQPPWAPPSWLFGPVWTILYAMIALAGWLLWRSAGGLSEARIEFTAYAVGLVLNALWTPLFFGLGAYTLALIELVALDVVLAATIVLFLRRNKVAGVLLMPYLGWVLFATALNGAIVAMN